MLRAVASSGAGVARAAIPAVGATASRSIQTYAEFLADRPKSIDNYVDNQFVKTSSGRGLDVVSPVDGSLVGHVGFSTHADIDAAVASAAKAFPAWSKKSVKERVQPLFKFHELLIQHSETLADLITLEHGKNKVEALGSVAKGNETVEYACSLPQLLPGNILPVSTGVTCQDFRDPVGVVCSITPFNFPAMVALWTVPMAIACGNTMILKPSEKVPLTWQFMMQLWKEAGIPDGVINIVNGDKDTVEYLCDHKDIAALTFVGSTAVARDVYMRCRNNNKKVVALGGAKNHLIALPDCNMEMTATDIVNSFTGCGGQRCMAASVLLVVGEQQELIDRMVEKAKSIKLGCAGGEVGPVIDEASQQRILRYVDEAEANGAKILVDGRTTSKDKGTWVGPTMILHNSHEDAAVREEIFGPVISIVKCKTKEEAMAIENSNEYGNAAAVYTSVGEHAEWFYNNARAGMIGVNVGVPVPREPFSFGGIQWSKFGDMDITGDGGMEFFTTRRKVTIKWTPPPNRTWMD